MKFQMPETLDGLKLAKVSELAAAARAEATELAAIDADKITDEQSDDLIALFGFVGTLEDREGELQVEADERAAAIEAARAGLAAADEDDPEGGEDDPEDDPEGGEGDHEDVEVEDGALVAAGAKKPAAKRSFASKVSKTPGEKPEPKAEAPKGLAITAAANIPGFSSGQPLDSIAQLADAYVGRGKMFASGGTKGGMPVRAPGRYEMSNNATRYAVAKLEKPENPFTIGEKDGAEQQFDIIKAAAKEGRLAGGSLVAAGGWCSPSEQIYGFLELESADGMLSIPEINAKRGGIQFTQGPDLGSLLAETDLGWHLTEAQVIAGATEKPCYEIECPDWDEVRMDAVGFCIRAGLLTNATYPELIRRYLGLGLLVHARRMNALTITQISTLITATSAFAAVQTGGAGYQSTTSDILDAIELNALRIREQYSMPLNSSLEAVFPLWVKAFIRSDLSRRPGEVDFLNISDAQIDQWFRARGIAAQFVRDYQGINSGAANTAGGTAAWTTYPTQFTFMLYPAGAFVRLATDVIDLDTVYDTDGLQNNTYTAAFFEEGFGIANTGGSGVKVTVQLGNRFGATGYPLVGAKTAVTFS
jgi:hypothetical protein